MVQKRGCLAYENKLRSMPDIYPDGDLLTNRIALKNDRRAISRWQFEQLGRQTINRTS